jgi:hypothetical protein
MPAFTLIQLYLTTAASSRGPDAPHKRTVYDLSVSAPGGARKTPCSGDPRETDMIDAFAREGLHPLRWSNGPGDAYAPHSHDYHKVLYCLRGSITFRIEPAAETIDLHPGDRLDIEPGTLHSALVGPDGVTCAEAPRS